MIFRVDVERGSDGRWLAEVRESPGVMAYGPTAAEADWKRAAAARPARCSC
jgi:predicted RNase H-like HicB family nuclease